MIKTLYIYHSVLFALISVGSAQTSTNSEPSTDRIHRHDTYTQLSRKIFAQHSDPDSEKMHISEPGKISAIRSKLHTLISAEIRDVLTAKTPAPNDVKNALATLQGDMTLPANDMTNTPFADIFDLNGLKTTAAAYVILQGGEAIPDTQPYLEFYDHSSGDWQMKAEARTRQDFRGRTFYVSRMNSGASGEAWFLAWGVTIGNSGTPLNVRLYGFDGNAVRTVWKRDDLTRGTITVEKGSIMLEYDREYGSPDAANRVHETLHITPNGLE